MAGLTAAEQNALAQNSGVAAGGFNSRRSPTFPSLVYPIEMKPENFYPEAMCFTIKKRIGLSLKDVGTAVGQSMKEPRRKLAEQSSLQEQYEKKLADAAFLGEAKQKKFDEAKAWFKVESDRIGLGTGIGELATMAVDAGSRVADLHKALPKGNTTVNNIGHIYLNMPQAIAYDDSISWDAKPLGTVGAIMDSGFGDAGKGAAIGNAGNIASAGIGGMLTGLVSKLKLGSIGIGALLGGMAGDSLQNGLSATLGMASNPYEEMMFSGITFRSFTFDFIFRPESEDEIKVVDKIIKMFRKYSRPSFVSEEHLGKSIMNYPMEYGIEFLTADSGNTEFKGQAAKSAAAGEVYKTNTHLPLIKTCVCEKVSTNYTPQSVWAAYNSGAPVAISLSLGFKEKELVMEKDVEGGY
jgi:hypothetical protein